MKKLTSYSGEVVRRMFADSPKALAEFEEMYQNAKRSQGSARIPASREDFNIFADYRAGALNCELAQKYGKSYQQVLTAICRASAEVPLK